MAHHVAAIGTSDEGYSTYFDLSCETVGGIKPVILGSGQKWEGFHTGINLVVSWLQTLKDSDVVLLLDRYDLVITNPLAPVFDHFNRQRSKVPLSKPYYFVSSEHGTLLGSILFGSVTGHKHHVNTGTVMGTARDMLAMYSEISKCTGLSDDQKLIIEYFNKNAGNVELELDEQKFFIVYFPGDIGQGAKMRFRDGGCEYPSGIKKLKISGESTLPVLVHRPVNADMSALLDDLGYTVDMSKIKRPGYLLTRLAHWGGMIAETCLRRIKKDP